MTNNLIILVPEIFLSLSILILLMLGVFIKNSYNIITKLSLLTLIATAFLVNNNNEIVIKLFSDSFISDSFTNFIKMLTLISSFFVLNSSQIFIKDNNINKFEYPIIILLSILGMFFMISSNDLILFYLGLELQSLSLYILAAIDRDNIKSSESGIKYFVLSALSSGLLLYGSSLLYGFTGSTNFDKIAIELTDQNNGAIFATVFILVGLAFKISAVPFHMWTPDVYEGSPTSVTSFFAVVPKIAGFAVLVRFMQTPFQNIILEWQTIMIFLSIASMILGAVAAIGQTNIKRLMAYSSIGHIGYALAGVATATKSGFSSSILYLSIYVIMNIGAFACIFLMKKNGKYTEDIKDLSGISKKNPLIAISFLIILFSLAGIPPLGGFFAKFYIFMSVIENGMYTLAIIGLLTTVVSAFYYLRIIKIIYFDELEKPFDEIKNISITSTVLISCLLLVTFFLKPSFLNNIINSIFIY
jgi:NADH-quinone oxidoreductase subunit N